MPSVRRHGMKPPASTCNVDLMDVLSGYGASRWVGLGKICDPLQIPSRSFLTKPISRLRVEL